MSLPLPLLDSLLLLFLYITLYNPKLQLDHVKMKELDPSVISSTPIPYEIVAKLGKEDNCERSEGQQLERHITNLLLVASPPPLPHRRYRKRKKTKNWGGEDAGGVKRKPDGDDKEEGGGKRLKTE